LSLNDRVGDLLPRLNEAFPADLLDVLGSFLQKEAGASDVALLLADYDLRELRSLRPGDRAVVGDWVPLVGSDAGRCFATQATVAVPTGDDVRIHVPVTLRAERIGVLSVVLPEPTGADVLRGLEGVATTLAYVMQAATNYTDVFEQARRRKPLTLEAEMQWAMQPVQAFASDQFALAGQLVPAYDVGGDNYDWVINRETVCIAAIDAMGHGVNASLLGALGMTALRNARRAGASLSDRARAGGPGDLPAVRRRAVRHGLLHGDRHGKRRRYRRHRRAPAAVPPPEWAGDSAGAARAAPARALRDDPLRRGARRAPARRSADDRQ
jgi:hypothetical protein